MDTVATWTSDYIKSDYMKSDYMKSDYMQSGYMDSVTIYLQLKLHLNSHSR